MNRTVGQNLLEIAINCNSMELIEVMENEIDIRQLYTSHNIYSVYGDIIIIDLHEYGLITKSKSYNDVTRYLWELKNE